MTLRATHPGMTLIETLAVLVLFATATAVTVGVIPQVSGASQLQAAKIEVRSTLERARTKAAQGDGAIVVFGDQDRIDEHGDTPLVRFDLPENWLVTAFERADDEAITSLRFDSRGRSLDFRVELTRSGQDSPAAVFTVLGLSGQIIEEGRAR